LPPHSKFQATRFPVIALRFSGSIKKTGICFPNCFRLWQFSVFLSRKPHGESFQENGPVPYLKNANLFRADFARRINMEAKESENPLKRRLKGFRLIAIPGEITPPEPAENKRGFVQTAEHDAI